MRMICIPRSAISQLFQEDGLMHFLSAKNCDILPHIVVLHIRLCTLDILFSSNHNIHKNSCNLCFWASDPLIDRFYQNLSIKGSEAQKTVAGRTIMNVVI